MGERQQQPDTRQPPPLTEQPPPETVQEQQPPEILNLSDEVQVIRPGDKHDGMVGSVNKITSDDQGDEIHVLLKGEYYTHPFRRDELKLVRPVPAVAPKRSFSPRWWPWLIVAGVAAIAVVIAESIWAASPTDAEQRYLNAMHDPCQHPEVFDNPTYCSFVWEGDQDAPGR